MNIHDISPNEFGALVDGMHIKTEIKSSAIAGAGQGRFFTQDCTKGTIVRAQSIDTDLYVFNNLDELKQANMDDVINFSHTVPRGTDMQTSQVFINKERLYTNHSFNNNIAFKFIGNKKVTYTTCDVKLGEEMLQNYLDYTPVPWFEEYLRHIGKMNQRMFALSLDKNGSKPDTEIR